MKGRDLFIKILKETESKGDKINKLEIMFISYFREKDQSSSTYMEAGPFPQQ